MTIAATSAAIAQVRSARVHSIAALKGRRSELGTPEDSAKSEAPAEPATAGEGMSSGISTRTRVKVPQEEWRTQGSGGFGNGSVPHGVGKPQRSRSYTRGSSYL